METAVEALEGGKKKLTVTVDAKDVDARIRKTYKDVAYRYNFPGFRRGKAPRPVVDSMLGKEAVLGQVTEDVLNEFAIAAMDELDIAPVGDPTFEQDAGLVKDGQPYSFWVEVLVAPELELSSYDPISITLPVEEATEAEIDAQVDQMREYYYDFRNLNGNAKVKEGSFCDLNMKATDEAGEPVDAFSSESRIYEVGAGLLPKSFDEAIIGLKKGGTATVTVDMGKSPVLASAEKDAGKVTFDVTVNVVKEKVLPEVTEEWVKEKLRFDSVEKMREAIKENIEQQKKSMMSQLRENEALFELQKRVEGDVPDELVNTAVQTLVRTFFQQLARQDMSFDAYLAQTGMKAEDFSMGLRMQGLDETMQDIALSAWARHAGIEVTDADVAREFALSGAEDPEKLQQEWRESGRMPQLREGIRRSKALDNLYETLQVTNVEDYEEFQKARSEEREAYHKDRIERAKAAAAEAEAAQAAEPETTDEAPEGDAEAAE